MSLFKEKIEDTMFKIKNFSQNIYEKDVVSVSEDTDLCEVAKIMKEKHIGNVVVMNKNAKGSSQPIGIVTDRDLALKAIGDRELGFEDRSLRQIFVSEIMTRSLACAHEDDGVYEIIKIMKDKGVGRLPVINKDGNLVGIVTAKKILKLLVQELNDLVHVAEKQKEQEMHH